jgi:uncharacterized SAM-binding protein YcdF (DUF218 family)
MLIDKILSLCIYPSGFTFLLGIIGAIFLMLGNKKLTLIIWGLGIIYITICSLPIVSHILVDSLENRSTYLKLKLVPQADVIIVFGGVIRREFPDYPFPDLDAAADRIWHAARLYHDKKAPKIILSGGRNDWERNSPSQAKTMAIFLKDLGVPEDAIILEEESRNTFENAIYCKRIMISEKMKNALLVTSALHMPRSKSIMEKINVDFIPISTDFMIVNNNSKAWDNLPNAGSLNKTTYAIHEWIGIIVYKWRGWI